MTQPSHDVHQGQPQDPSHPGSPYGPAAGSPDGHPGTGAPVYDQYAPTGVYPQGFAGTVGGPFQGASGQGGTGQAGAPVGGQGQGQHPVGYPQPGPSQPDYQGPGYYPAGSPQPAPYQQPVHSPYPTAPPAQQPAPQPAASSAAPAAYSGYQAVAHNPQPSAVSAAPAQAAPGSPYSAPAYSPVPQAVGATAAAPQASGPSMDPRTKGPSMVMGAGALISLLGLVLATVSTVIAIDMGSGLSEISTNGSVRAQLHSGQEYGLYHKSGGAPTCTVSDPDGEEVTVAFVDNTKTLNHLHFATFTAQSSGAHVITCEGSEEDTLWASQLVTSHQESVTYLLLLCGILLVGAGAAPFIAGAVLRARRRKAFLRAQMGITPPVQAVSSAFGQGSAWQS